MKKCKEILIGVLLLSMVFFTACTSKAAKAMEKVELGQKYLTELNYTEAVASLQKLLVLIRRISQHIWAVQKLMWV